MFEPEVFRKQIHCIEESAFDIVGTFQRPSQLFCAPIMIRRPGNYAPLTPRYAPAHTVFRQPFVI